MLRGLAPVALVLGAGVLGFWQGSVAQAAPAVQTVTVDVDQLKDGTATLVKDPDGSVRMVRATPTASGAPSGTAKPSAASTDR